MKKIPLMTQLIIPVGIVINLICRQVTSTLALPIFLDTTGTILIGVLTGPVGGLMTGLLSAIIRGITINPVALYFAPVGCVIGLIVGYFSKMGAFKSTWKILIVGVIMALGGIIVSTPIAVIAFGGADGSGSSILTGIFLATKQGIWQSVLSTKLITESFDKIIALFVAIYILRNIPESTLVKFKLGNKLIKKN